jgi:hypothetical protein
MKVTRLFFGLFLGTLMLSACNKIENPIEKTGIPASSFWLYPYGDSLHYSQNAMPSFLPNSNTDRNVLIESFTGHRCIFCGAVGHEADSIAEVNLNRAFVSSIHAGPSGLTVFQESNPGTVYAHDFTCPEGLETGLYFGDNYPNSPFVGIPFGMINRTDNGSGFLVVPPVSWNASTSSILLANNLKVNIQSAKNYYPSTRGVFVHTEVEVLDPTLTNELRIVVQLIEDSIIKPQQVQLAEDTFDGTVDGIDHLYVHRDILRACIDGNAFGQELDATHLNAANGKYYVDYAYELPMAYDASNSHLLIYVRDAVTEEVYQVIKQEIQ